MWGQPPSAVHSSETRLLPPPARQTHHYRTKFTLVLKRRRRDNTPTFSEVAWPNTVNMDIRTAIAKTSRVRGPENWGPEKKTHEKSRPPSRRPDATTAWAPNP